MQINREIDFTKGWEALPPQRRHFYFFILLFLLMMLAANLYGASEWPSRPGGNASPSAHGRPDGRSAAGQSLSPSPSVFLQ